MCESCRGEWGASGGGWAYLHRITLNTGELRGHVADYGITDYDAELWEAGFAGPASWSLVVSTGGEREREGVVVNSVVPTRISNLEQPRGMSLGLMGTGSPIETPVSGSSGQVWAKDDAATERVTSRVGRMEYMMPAKAGLGSGMQNDAKPPRRDGTTSTYMRQTRVNDSVIGMPLESDLM